MFISLDSFPFRLYNENCEFFDVIPLKSTTYVRNADKFVDVLTNFEFYLIMVIVLELL